MTEILVVIRKAGRARSGFLCVAGSAALGSALGREIVHSVTELTSSGETHDTHLRHVATWE